jgi:hypothetical protein
MGWDVTLVKLRPGMDRPPLPRSSEQLPDEALTVFDPAELENVLRSLPGSSPNGPGFYAFQDIPELSASELGVSVGHAKLEPLLALHHHLEAWQPGWLFLNVSDGSLHDVASLRRWLDERAAVAALARKTHGL